MIHSKSMKPTLKILKYSKNNRTLSRSQESKYSFEKKSTLTENIKTVVIILKNNLFYDYSMSDVIKPFMKIFMFR